MITRFIFLFIALLLAGTVVWAYQHDQKLDHDAALINIGDPNETVREVMGEPTSEGECGSVGVAPQACADEYVYRYYYSIFRPKYQVIWFDHSGKVIGEQHVARPF
jgi:hypothetical protein